MEDALAVLRQSHGRRFQDKVWLVCPSPKATPSQILGILRMEEHKVVFCEDAGQLRTRMQLLYISCGVSSFFYRKRIVRVEIVITDEDRERVLACFPDSEASLRTFEAIATKVQGSCFGFCHCLL
jgi:hypothetical protein